jgi:alpha-beta hydrolase superfamily lysophospholipase
MAGKPVLRQHKISAADGTALQIFDHWISEPGAGKGGIVIMHGLGEHSGRYSHVVRFFNECGLSVRCYDHRGHGKSEGPRGDVPNGDVLLQDAQIVIEDFANQLAEPPLLLGHSMGGLYAARFALANLAPLRGVILSSPALAIYMSGGQKLLLKILNLLAPRLGIPNGLDVKGLSHDPAVVKAYKNDSLVHSRITARLLIRMLAAMEFCQAHASEMSIPLLMVVAGSDRLVDPAGSRAFFPRLPAGLATMHLYDALYHELFNEIDARPVFDDVRRWLQAHDFAF